jgi:tetratricopeptide (TPR) repeat protein
MEYSGLIADHLERAGRGEEAAVYLIRAGEAALSTYANHEAERYFRRAFGSVKGRQAKADAAYGLGEALYRLGNDHEAIEVWRQGIKNYQSMNDLEGVARLHEAIVRTLVLKQPEEALKVCRDALAAVQGLEASPALARLLSQTARACLFAGHPEEVKPFALQALAMGESLGDAEVQADSLATLGLVLPDVEETLSVLERAVALADENFLLATSYRAHNNLGIILFRFFGDLDSLYDHGYRTIEIARQRGVIKEEVFALLNLVDIPLARGEFDQVEEKFGQVERLLKDVDLAADELRSVEAGRWAVAARKGEWLAAYRYFNENYLGELVQNFDHFYSILMRDVVPLALDLDRFGYDIDWALIESRFEELIELSERGLGLDWVIFSKCTLSTIHARQRRIESARDLLQTAKKDAHPSLMFLEKAIILRTEAELAFTENRWGDSINSYQELIELYDRSGWYWDGAWNRLNLALTFDARRMPGDPELAKTNYMAAMQAFARMKAHGYVKMIQEKLESIE